MSHYQDFMLIKPNTSETKCRGCRYSLFLFYIIRHCDMGTVVLFYLPAAIFPVVDQHQCKHTEISLVMSHFSPPPWRQLLLCAHSLPWLWLSLAIFTTQSTRASMPMSWSRTSACLRATATASSTRGPARPREPTSKVSIQRKKDTFVITERNTIHWTVVTKRRHKVVVNRSTEHVWERLLRKPRGPTLSNSSNGKSTSRHRNRLASVLTRMVRFMSNADDWRDNKNTLRKNPKRKNKLQTPIFV